MDIGGNIGEYTAELLNVYPNLEIHVFEPSTTNTEKLSLRYKNDELVKIVPLAVSDVSESVTLFSDFPGSGLSSITKRKLEHLNIMFDTEENVECIRFEDYWKTVLCGRKIDIVKIDIEGNEFNALRGFGCALKAIKIIQFEFGGCNVDTRTYFRDFWYFFKENNFDLYRVAPFYPDKITRYREADEYFMTTNYVAINRL